ncbi:hypothetical protein V1477_001075 [Vespula maculifrons]|uniref:Uncharacterized protein n=1 Tax=Vespula maculifrons TaxID=7453 RepID=A0ABD2D0Q4_VESMC
MTMITIMITIMTTMEPQGSLQRAVVDSRDHKSWVLLRISKDVVLEIEKFPAVFALTSKLDYKREYDSKLANQPTNQPTNQQTNQLTNQQTNQPTNQPDFNQPIRFEAFACAISITPASSLLL